MHTHPKTENLKRKKEKEVCQAYMDQKRAGITISLKLEFAKALTWIKNIWKEYKNYKFVYTKYRLKL